MTNRKKIVFFCDLWRVASDVIIGQVIGPEALVAARHPLPVTLRTFKKIVDTPREIWDIGATHGNK